LTDLEHTVAELQQRLQSSLAERDELLLEQAATAEILKVIISSPGNLAPVFEAILEKAILLRGASFGALTTHGVDASCRRYAGRNRTENAVRRRHASPPKPRVSAKGRPD